MTAIRNHISTRLPTGHRTERPDAVIKRLASGDFDSMAVAFVVDEQNVFLGQVPMIQLFKHADDACSLGDLMETGGQSFDPDADREEVSSYAIRQDLSSVAITDATGHFLGAVTPREIMAVLREEHLEDLHRITGILRFSKSATMALEESPVSRMKHRMPWLFIGLIGSMVATSIMAGFEEMLGSTVVVAFFIPMIVYLADAVGTQTEAIAVRGLSLANSDLRAMLLGELGTGALIGIGLALVAMLFELAIFGVAGLAVVLGISIFSACTIATLIGLLLPWTFARLGWDPALASGPLATVIQDVLSLVVFLTFAALILQ